jgi:hypothetical protein
MAVLERVPHHEEREEQKQFQHLETGEFTLMPFLNSDAGEIEVLAGDGTDYTINSPVIIIFRKK